MPGPHIGEIASLRPEVINVKCRNFNPLSITKLLRLIDAKKSSFYLFTRHPASFFRSAATYHLRGGEEWARTNVYPHLGGSTLHEALIAAEGNSERLLVSMKHFGLAWTLIDKWVQNHRLLQSLKLEIEVVRIEDLFTCRDASYYELLADSMRKTSFRISATELMRSSPAFMPELPLHSTGEFQKDVFHGYGKNSLQFYEDNFASQQSELYGGDLILGDWSNSASAGRSNEKAI